VAELAWRFFQEGDDAERALVYAAARRDAAEDAVSRTAEELKR